MSQSSNGLCAYLTTFTKKIRKQHSLPLGQNAALTLIAKTCGYPDYQSLRRAIIAADPGVAKLLPLNRRALASALDVPLTAIQSLLTFRPRGEEASYDLLVGDPHAVLTKDQQEHLIRDVLSHANILLSPDELRKRDSKPEGEHQWLTSSQFSQYLGCPDVDLSRFLFEEGSFDDPPNPVNQKYLRRSPRMFRRDLADRVLGQGKWEIHIDSTEGTVIVDRQSPTFTAVVSCLQDIASEYQTVVTLKMLTFDASTMRIEADGSATHIEAKNIIYLHTSLDDTLRDQSVEDRARWEAAWENAGMPEASDPNVLHEMIHESRLPSFEGDDDE
jgi:hypothetical protein